MYREAEGNSNKNSCSHMKPHSFGPKHLLQNKEKDETLQPPGLAMRPERPRSLLEKEFATQHFTRTGELIKHHSSWALTRVRRTNALLLMRSQQSPLLGAQQEQRGLRNRQACSSTCSRRPQRLCTLVGPHNLEGCMRRTCIDLTPCVTSKMDALDRSERNGHCASFCCAKLPKVAIVQHAIPPKAQLVHENNAVQSSEKLG